MLFSPRPLLIFFLTLSLVSACAPVQKRVPASKTQALNPADLPITILQPGRSAGVKNASRPEPSGADPLLPELQNLVSQRRADLLSRPGWLHLVTRNAGDGSGLSSLWGRTPDTWQEEEWLELDAHANILQAVKRLLNADLQPLQNSMLVNHTWLNLTLGLEQPAQESATFDPNYGFFDLAVRLTGQGYALGKSTIYKECWYQGEQYSIGDGTYSYTAVFNPDKRSLRWLKTWKIAPGPVTLLQSKEILVEEQVEQPPAEILSLLHTNRSYSLR